MNPDVFMLSPFLRAQRGNTVTVKRISSGLRERGWDIELFSTEGEALPPSGGIDLKPSVKLLHGFNASYTGMLLQKAPALRRLPLLLTMTGTDLEPESLRQNAYTRLALSSCKATVVFHQSFIKNIASELPATAGNIICIPQGVALPALCPAEEVAKRRPDEVRLLLPSGLRPVKDIMLVLDAFARLKPRYPQLTLCLAGCAIDPDYARKVVNTVNRQKDVCYLNEIDFNRMPAFYAAGDIVINSSVFEGQPQAALEAMSLGIPAMLRDVPGNRGVITAGREGYYFDSAEELAAGIAELIENPARRQAMGTAARRLVSSRYTVKKEIDAYDAIYRQLI
ncbi:MAG: glycosyltransferase [Syntrophomonadaceae bacterium]|nr:glycosyltransferase [Syntrophomonadaceae bacterium]